MDGKLSAAKLLTRGLMVAAGGFAASLMFASPAAADDPGLLGVGLDQSGLKVNALGIDVNAQVPLPVPEVQVQALSTTSVASVSTPVASVDVSPQLDVAVATPVASVDVSPTNLNVAVTSPVASVGVSPAEGVQVDVGAPAAPAPVPAEPSAPEAPAAPAPAQEAAPAAPVPAAETLPETPIAVEITVEEPATEPTLKSFEFQPTPDAEPFGQSLVSSPAVSSAAPSAPVSEAPSNPFGGTGSSDYEHGTVPNTPSSGSYSGAQSAPGQPGLLGSDLFLAPVGITSLETPENVRGSYNDPSLPPTTPD